MYYAYNQRPYKRQKIHLNSNDVDQVIREFGDEA